MLSDEHMRLLFMPKAIKDYVIVAVSTVGYSYSYDDGVLLPQILCDLPEVSFANSHNYSNLLPKSHGLLSAHNTRDLSISFVP